MNFNKRSSGSWTDTSHYIMGTSTDILSLPSTLYPNDTSVTVGIKGNTTQSGTPTPSNPVDVVGVGELEISGEHSGQYKIPILLNSTTVNKYLGEEQTTRNVKKLVLSGQEGWEKYSSTADSYLYYLTGFSRADVSDCICTHTPYSSSVPNGSDAGVRISDSRSVLLLNCGSTTIQNNTKEDFKAWLAQQYQNGTPVCVWYVLATPQTAVVNEPLMKIGTYADSLTTTIPCTAGENTLDVQTTVEPSEVTANFSGWHPVSAAHERENGAWT